MVYAQVWVQNSQGEEFIELEMEKAEKRENKMEKVFRHRRLLSLIHI